MTRPAHPRDEHITYGSECSGIEAASLAWHGLGWTPAWFAEIEPFPCQLLAHRFPHVPNLGDMTKIAAMVRAGTVPAPDVLVGGTPCQAFSIAGLRGGLSDERGALTLSFVESANAIDDVRVAAGKPECVVVWENVPGVLSSTDNAFGCFLGALCGEGSELQPPRDGWENAGCVFGPQRTIAWRTLDAQYFGLAQRRRRVFVVASARQGFNPATILFEFDGLRRDFAPSREAREDAARDAGNSADARPGKISAEVACLAHGQGGAELAVGRSPTLTCNHEAPIVIGDVAGTLQSNGKAAGSATQQDAESGLLVVHGTQDPDILRDMAHTLGRNSGQENAVAYPLLEVGKRTGVSTTDPRAGLGIGADGDPMYTLQAGAQHGVALSVALRGREGGATAELGDDVAGCLRASTGGGDKPHVLTRMAVRRLMPVECERLQGMPDNWTLVPVGKKMAADGPRYKAIGNSMAVKCMLWIGERIDSALRAG